MSQGIERFYLLSFCLACCWPGFNASSNLRVVRQWSELKMNFPSPEAEQIAQQNMHNVPGSAVPIDVDAHYITDGDEPRIFVTLPRIDETHPISLGTVDDQGRISAYPDYSWHTDRRINCNGITSVYRVAIDECNRLWVIDNGKVLDNQMCPPQVLAFDLDTDQLVFKHVVNSSNYVQASLFITPVVDVRGDCSKTFLYVADVAGFMLLVVDVARNQSWRCTHRLFYPYPNWGSFTIEGDSFELMDGVFGMSLSPYHEGRDRYLFFHAFSAATENVILTSILRNVSLIHNPELNANAIYVYPHKRSSQSAAEAIDRDGIMYFGLMNPPSIWCWNTNTEYSSKNLHQIAIDHETLQFAGGVKVVNNLKGEQELWILTSSLQRVITGSLSSDRVNYRIHTEKIPVLMANSPCKTQSYPKGNAESVYLNSCSEFDD